MEWIEAGLSGGMPRIVRARMTGANAEKGRRTICQQTVLSKQQQPGTKTRSQAQFMYDQQDGFSRSTKLSCKAKNLFLIKNIQPCCWLVQQHNRGLLRQNLGQ